MDCSPFEQAIEISGDEPQADKQTRDHWRSEGWDPNLSREQNKKNMRKHRIKERNKYISGVDEVKFNIYPYGGVKSFSPGTELKVCIRLKIKDGYHIYGTKEGFGYKNTEMKWELPEGFKVINLTWPEPKIVKHSGYEMPVYKEELYFRVTLRTSEKAVKGKKYKIRINTNFQYCNKDVCQLGEANNEIEYIAK